MKVRRCRDCDPTAKRPAPHPGPRCATHHRAAVRRTRAKSHDAHIARVFGVVRGFYAALLALQEGRCAICRVATGKARRLAMDHDHATNRPRGLLCGPCNQVLGLWRDDPERFHRAARYLMEPPATALLGVPGETTTKETALVDAGTGFEPATSGI